MRFVFLYLYAFAFYSPAMANPFVEAAQSRGESSERLYAISEIGRPNPSSEELDVLLTVAQNQNEPTAVRAEAIDALGNTESAFPLPALIKLFKLESKELSSKTGLRRHLLLALEKIGAPQAFDDLLEFLNLPAINSVEEKALAIRALGKTRDPRVLVTIAPFLSRKHEPPLIHHATVFALGYSGDPRALQILEKILTQNQTADHYLNFALATALLEIGKNLRAICEGPLRPL